MYRSTFSYLIYGLINNDLFLCHYQHPLQISHQWQHQEILSTNKKVNSQFFFFFFILGYAKVSFGKIRQQQQRETNCSLPSFWMYRLYLQVKQIPAGQAVASGCAPAQYVSVLQPPPSSG